MTPTHTIRILALAMIPCLAALALAQDSVDLQLTGKDKVTGTLRPATERESYRCDVVAGTRIIAAVKAKGKGGPVPRVVLVRDAAPETPFLAGVPNRKGAKLKTDPLPETARYRLRVTGDGELDGDYQLKVKFKPPRVFKPESDVDVGAGEEDEFTISAPRGTTAKIVLKAAKKSAFVPDLLEVVAPDDSTQALGGGKKAVLDLGGAGGDYRVRFRNAGTEAGGWRAVVSLKLPRIPAFTIDLTPEALVGGRVGGQQVTGAVFGNEGGTLLAPETGGPLDGTSFEVPGGALDLPTLITMGPGEDFPAPGATGAAGPPVEFGPSGTVFNEDATATLPFDSQFFDDPESEVSVVVKDGETGEVEVVGPLDVDEGESNVSFPVSHFSTFQVVSGLPRPFGGEFAELGVSAATASGGSSRIAVELNFISADRDVRTGNSVQTSREAYVLRYVLGAPGTVSVDQETNLAVGQVDVLSDRFLDLDIGPDGATVSAQRGTSNDVFVTAPSLDDPSRTSVIVRLAPTAPTAGALAGNWHLIVWEFNAEARDAGTALGGVAQNAIVQFRADGRVGVVSTVAGSRAPRPGTFTIDGQTGELFLDMRLGADANIPAARLAYCLNGDVLMGVSGTDPATTAGSVRAIYLTRLSSGARTSDLSGPFAAGNVAAEGITSGFGIQYLNSGGGVITFDGEGRYDGTATDFRLAHDGAGNPVSDLTPATISGRYLVNGAGQYFEKAGGTGRGAITRSGDLLVITMVERSLFGIGFAVGGVVVDQ